MQHVLMCVRVWSRSLHLLPTVRNKQHHMCMYNHALVICAVRTCASLLSRACLVGSRGLRTAMPARGTAHIKIHLCIVQSEHFYRTAIISTFTGRTFDSRAPYAHFSLTERTDTAKQHVISSSPFADHRQAPSQHSCQLPRPCGILMAHEYLCFIRI